MILSVVRWIRRVSVCICTRSTCENVCRQDGDRQSSPSPPYSWTSRDRHWMDSSQTSWLSVESYKDTKSAKKNGLMNSVPPCFYLGHAVTVEHRWKSKQLRLLQEAGLTAKVIKWMHQAKQKYLTMHQSPTHPILFSFLKPTKFCSVNDFCFRDHIDAPALSILRISQGAQGPGVCPCPPPPILHTPTSNRLCSSKSLFCLVQNI